MSRLNFDSNRIEDFAIKVIQKSYDNLYEQYVWHGKDDNFDFTSSNDKFALEVASIIPLNELNVIQYEKALDKGKKPDARKVVDACINDKGEMLTYYGGSMSEIRSAVLKMISQKELKRKRRSKADVIYELCLIIDDGGLFNSSRDFDFIIRSNILNTTGFSRLFIITCSNFYIVEGEKIEEKERII